MTFEQHVQSALARHEAGFHALPAVLAALEALARERLERGQARDERGMFIPPAPPGSIDRLRVRLSRSNALADLARNDAEELWPEPHSVSHWGMVA
jgi:hypothetical protein